jgi:hypothetical protein
VIELAVDFFASAVIIKAEIWNNNLTRFSLCDMVFDTGATMTTIDTAIAKRAGYRLKNEANVSVYGVGGMITAKRMVLRNFLLGKVELGPVSVDVIDFPKEGNTFAVLGMNVIKEFNVKADFKDKRPVPDKRDATIYLEPTFNIQDKPIYEDFSPFTSRFGIWLMSK